MTNGINRRQFIRLAGFGAAGAGLAYSGLNPWGLSAHADLTHTGSGVREIPTFCELCFWKCGVIAKVKDGRIIKLEGHPGHPLSNGRLCPRGNGGTGLTYDKDRLRQPLIRAKKRGEDVFREVTWDDALDHIAEKMIYIRDEWSADCFALFNHGYGATFIKHLIKAYGSHSIAAPSYAQCRGPREVGFDLTFGEEVLSPERTDIVNTRMLVLIGSHLGENMHNTQVQEFADAISNGAKLVVVDPRHSVAAGKADWYLPIKPATDIALLLAWMNVIINEDLYDKEYVDKYTVGFEQLVQHVKSYSPEKVWTITGIKPELIRRTAREMGHQKPAVLIHPGRHVTWYGDDTQRSRAIAILNALLGSWGRKGGFFYPGELDVPKPETPPYPKPSFDRVDLQIKNYPLAYNTLASGLCDATFPAPQTNCQLKAWFVYGTNLVHSLPKPQQTMEAMQHLKFLVVSDVLPMEIVGWADVVLPDATYLERYDDLHVGRFREPFVALRQPVIEPMYDTRPPWWVAKELAKRLNLDSYFPWDNIEQYLDNRLATVGLKLSDLKRDGVKVFPRQPLYFEDGIQPEFFTNSGKIELYSSSLAAHGYDPIPVYTEHGEPPQGYYRLLFGRAPVHTFGRTTNNPVLNRVIDSNEVWVNRRVAEEWSLENGGDVILKNQDGVESSPVRIKVTERIRSDCVYMVHGFGHKAKRLTNKKGANDSDLITRYNTDPIMGGTGMNVNFVTFVT
ncbi:nitrate reductase [candidate division LCP-89 bacterium B3_LCP]|uniref:Nitrate reductase n=1 Tax=candidate division LCP-89 bacterium B3_LCP TaxID=2012998 RepID=A0A532UW06_UNCL8|nr:MAG: nitrate reductase [candidate division LCP-89 bacterium B3_LCP]